MALSWHESTSLSPQSDRITLLQRRVPRLFGQKGCPGVRADPSSAGMNGVLGDSEGRFSTGQEDNDGVQVEP